MTGCASTPMGANKQGGRNRSRPDRAGGGAAAAVRRGTAPREGRPLGLGLDGWAEGANRPKGNVMRTAVKANARLAAQIRVGGDSRPKSD